MLGRTSKSIYLIAGLLLLIGGFLVVGCNNQPKDVQAKKIIGDRVLIILAEEPDPQGKTIRLQDFVRDGKSYIPFSHQKVPLMNQQVG